MAQKTETPKRMFGFSPKLPVSEEERQWVDDGFRRLEKLLGRRTMVDARVIEPTAEDFPDPYDRSAAAAEMLFQRVCTYMRVDYSHVEFEIFQDETEELSALLPSWRSSSQKCAAGVYVAPAANDGTETEGRPTVAIRSSQLKDPLSLIATMAHELGHVVLLGRKLISNQTSDHEPLTDLFTVFVGMGIFTANSAHRFRQFQDDRRIGWSAQRLGYLPEQAFGYALARFAVERAEDKTPWAKFLSPNVRSDFKNSKRWLEKNKQYVATVKPIG